MAAVEQQRIPLVPDPQRGPGPARLSRVAASIAATWYGLRGWDVSWPLEPRRYDLLVTSGDEVRRVQIKSTTTREGRAWKVYVSTTSGGRRSYEPSEVDEFFIIDGDGSCFRIPVDVVAGKKALSLAAHERFQVWTVPIRAALGDETNQGEQR